MQDQHHSLGDRARSHNAPPHQLDPRGFLMTADYQQSCSPCAAPSSLTTSHPVKILGGKPAVTSNGSVASTTEAGLRWAQQCKRHRTARLTTAKGASRGEWRAPKTQHRVYDRSGSFAGRSTLSGEDTRFYDRKGSFNGRSTMSGNTTRFYDSHGAYAGRAETSGGTTKYYDKAGRYVGRRTK